MAAALVVSACSDSEPELTVEDRLELVAGRPLSPVEVASQLETADSLCQLDDQLLLRLWAKLDEQQFAFQEFVFTYHCPERVALIEVYVPPSTVSTMTGSTMTGSTTTGSTMTGSTTTGSTMTGSTTTDPRNSGVISNSEPDASTTSSTAASSNTTTPRFGGPDTSDPTSTGVGEGG